MDCILLGFFAGCGAGTRYHGALFLVVILVGSLCFQRVRVKVFQKRNLFLLLGSGTLFGCLFFVQNALLFSNPTYPFLDTFWGTGEITQRFTETYTREKYFSGLSLDHLLRLPLILVYDIVDGDMNDVLGFLPVVALALVGMTWQQSKTKYALFFFYYVVLCLFGWVQVRERDIYLYSGCLSLLQPVWAIRH